jgi:hypothetical protein
LFTFIESGHKLYSCDILRSLGVRVNVENVLWGLSAAICTCQESEAAEYTENLILIKKKKLHRVIYQNT